MGKQENSYLESLLRDFLGISNFLHPNLHGIYMDILFIISPYIIYTYFTKFVCTFYLVVK